jgi:acyl-CoA thioesterase-1
MAGAEFELRTESAGNSLLWHWVRFISSVRCAAAALGLLLFGCGGSRPVQPNAESPQAAPSAQREAKSTPNNPATNIDTRPVIVAFGDSLTAGFGAEPGKSFPDFLQKDLDAAGLNWRVVNAGVSGNTTTDGLTRLDEVLAYKPRVTIVEFGGNDGLRGLPIETTRANLEQIVKKMQGAGSQVVLAGMTLPPNYGPEYIRPFQKVYADLATQYKVTRIPFLLSDVALHPDLMQQDGIHPTAQGNEIVAKTVMPYLMPLLR